MTKQKQSTLENLVQRVIVAIDDSTIENVDGSSGVNPESFFEHDGLSNWLPEARAAISTKPHARGR